MSSVSFDTPTFVEAIQRAARVAPSKGSAYDKAGGIVIEVFPGDELPVVIRATNLDVYYMQWIEADVRDLVEPVAWRVNASVLAALAGALPNGNGKRVSMEQDGRKLVIKSAPRMVSKIPIMSMGGYPIWSAFNPDGLTDAHNLGNTLQRVEWAAAETNDVILSGVRFDGKSVVATDRYRIATMELKTEMDFEFVLRAKALTSVLPPSGHVKVGFDSDMLLVMPDDNTQIKVLAMAGDYPSVERIMERDKPNEVRVSKLRLAELINRALAVRGADRAPLLRLFLGREEVAVMLKNEDYGSLGDVLDVPGYCSHGRIELTFTPETVLAALQNSPGDDVTIKYDVNKPDRPIYLSGNQTYECWIAVRGKSDPS